MRCHNPWAARGNLDSTGNMVEIEPKWVQLDFGSIPQVLPYATQVSERRPGLMMHNFEAIGNCFGRSCGVMVKYFVRICDFLSI